MSLQSLERYCANSNIAGVTIIEYVPTTVIDRASYEHLVSPTGQFVGNIELTSGDWLKAPLIPTTRLWKEKQQSSDQGNAYIEEVAGTLPNMIPSVNYEFAKMAQYHFLLRITDGDSRRWLIGQLDSPLQFFADGTTGTTGQLKHHAVRWAAPVRKKAPGW